MDAVLERLRGKAIPVVRCESTEQAGELSEWLIQGGLTILEITTTVPGYADLVAKLTTDARLLVGTGTVLDAATAQAAVQAGARFLVSPCLVPEVIAVGRAANLPVIPGAATPTEILTAHRAGAAAVKLFPAEQLGGPGFLKAVRSVLPEVLLLPTGGIALEQVSDYFSAGAFAVGLGSQLASQREITAGARDEIVARAIRLAKRDTP